MKISLQNLVQNLPFFFFADTFMAFTSLGTHPNVPAALSQAEMGSSTVLASRVALCLEGEEAGRKTTSAMVPIHGSQCIKATPQSRCSVY